MDVTIGIPLIVVIILASIAFSVFKSKRDADRLRQAKKQCAVKPSINNIEPLKLSETNSDDKVPDEKAAIDITNRLIQNLAKTNNNIYPELIQIKSILMTIKSWITFFGVVTIAGIIVAVIYWIYWMNVAATIIT